MSPEERARKAIADSRVPFVDKTPLPYAIAQEIRAAEDAVAERIANYVTGFSITTEGWVIASCIRQGDWREG